MGFLDRIFGKKAKKTVQHEDLFDVEVTDVYIKVSHPNRPAEQIKWEDIEEIKIATTDEGPFLPDVWLLLIGKGHGCSIPQGSKGWDIVYDIVSKYDGFHFENAIRAATCTETQWFDLWKK